VTTRTGVVEPPTISARVAENQFKTSEVAGNRLRKSESSSLDAWTAHRLLETLLRMGDVLHADFGHMLLSDSVLASTVFSMGMNLAFDGDHD